MVQASTSGAYVNPVMSGFSPTVAPPAGQASNTMNPPGGQMLVTTPNGQMMLITIPTGGQMMPVTAVQPGGQVNPNPSAPPPSDNNSAVPPSYQQVQNDQSTDAGHASSGHYDNATMQFQSDATMQF